MRMLVLAFLALIPVLMGGQPVERATAPSPPVDAPQPPPPPEDFPGLDAIPTQRHWAAPGESPTFDLNKHVKLAGVAKMCSETLARAQWRQDIADQLDSTAHFDNCAFEGGLDSIAGFITLVDELELATNGDKATEAAALVGRALHGIQDFYAHTNYVELMAADGKTFGENLVLAVWTPQGRDEVRKLEKKGLVSGRVWWSFPKQCAAGVSTHAQLAKDSDEMPGGRRRLAQWNRSAHRAALELADLATRRFLRFAYDRWPALKRTCGGVVVYLPPVDRRPDPPEPTVGSVVRPVPACRRDPRMEPIVTTTLQHVLDSARRNGLAVPERVVVNPDRPVQGALSLQLVGDLPVGMADARGCPREGGEPSSPLTLDELSVRGLCQAVSSTPALIRCSGGEILEIAASDQARGRPNAALAYVFAHELSHILHADRSHFSAASRVIDLSRPAAEKRSLLYAMCEGSDASREADRKQEERADEEALVILRDLVQRSPYSKLRELKGAAITENAMSLERASSAAHQWLLRTGQDAPLPRRLLNQDLPASDEVSRAVARGLLCDIERSTKGRITIPVAANGTHPSEVDRLARAHEALAALGDGVPAVGGDVSDQAEQLLAAVGQFQKETAAQTAEFFGAVGRYLCEYVDQDRAVLCQGVNIMPPAASLEPSSR